MPDLVQLVCGWFSDLLDWLFELIMSLFPDDES